MTKPTGRPVGRPTLYSEEAADKILDGLYEGLDMIDAIEKAGFKRRTVYEWMDAHPEFRIRCARARDALTEVRLRDLREQIKTAQKQGVDPAILRVLASHEQWAAERIAPKLYGTKVQTEVTGADGGPIQHDHVINLNHLTDEQLEALEEALGGPDTRQ